MKIAIIGSGISGNTIAWQLKDEHDISIFEAENHIGGHTHTHDIDINGKPYAVDTGFIVFNERTYPNFIAMLDELGVASQSTEMSFSIKDSLDNLEYNGHNLNSLFAQRSNLFRPSFLRMIKDILRFNQQAIASLNNISSSLSLGDYLHHYDYGDYFINKYILPMGAAIWSTDPQKMLDFPAKFFIRFFANHGLLQIKDRPRWFTIKGGSRTYLQPMLKGLEKHIFTNCPIESVKRLNNQVLVSPANQAAQLFDAVFIATHSDQALRLRGSDVLPNEADILSKIAYQKNTAVLHTDSRLLPKRKRAWASWNYHINADQEAPVALTYYMNRLQSIDAPVDFCVTLNHHENIDPAKIIKTIDYYHPVFTADSIHAQSQQHVINNNNIYYCGAYWANGFHEDGMVSALNAIQHFQEDQHEKLSLSRTG